MTAEPPTKFHLKFLSSTEGRTGSSESTLLKVPHCWKSRVAAHFFKNTPVAIIYAYIKVLYKLNTSNSQIGSKAAFEIHKGHKVYINDL